MELPFVVVGGGGGGTEVGDVFEIGNVRNHYSDA